MFLLGKTKYLTRRNLRKEMVSFMSQFGAYWQELEVTGHFVSSGKKQREIDAGAQDTYPFNQSRTPTYGMMPAILRVGISISIYKVPKAHIQKPILSDSRS